MRLNSNINFKYDKDKNTIGFSATKFAADFAYLSRTKQIILLVVFLDYAIDMLWYITYIQSAKNPSKQPCCSCLFITLC